MGGTGGGYSSSFTSAEDLKKELASSKSEAEQKKFNQQASEFIADVLKDINSRDTEVIQKRLEDVKLKLEDEIDGTIAIQFGGSIQKNTFVNGLSDVDAMVLLNTSELATKSPEEVKEYFASKLRERYPNTQVEVGAMAITLKFRDTELQLLPTVKTSSGLKVPSWTGKSWSSIAPKKFNESLTKLNQSLGGALVPCIKLVKKIMGLQSPKKQISGYHVEALSLEIFQSYKGSTTPKDMTRHFFQQASSRVLTPTKETTGQSNYVDDYLGKAKSTERRNVSDGLSSVSRRLERAEADTDFVRWKKIFE